MQFDIIIIGAGIVGLNIALQLARRGPLRVLVLERGVGVGEGSTGASSAVCRHRYSTDELTLLARDGIEAYRNWSDYTGLSKPRAAFQAEGVLWMTCREDDWAEREQQRMQQLGVGAEVLNADEVRARFPALSTCTRPPDLESGAEHDCDHGGMNFFETDGGFVDPVSAAQDLVEACRERGVEIRFGEQVIGARTRDAKLESLRLASGVQLSAGKVINAAGPWCNALHQAVGLSCRWDLRPTRIQVLHRDRPASLEGHIPITVDMAGGIYFRTQNRGQQLLVSSVLEEDEKETVANPDEFRRETDQDFEVRKLHALHHRLPGLDYRSRIQGYCGLYTVNAQDVHPVVGPTAIDGYWVANGFSGHGFKLAPAVGAMVARAITGQRGAFTTDVPLAFLGIDREPIALADLSVLA